MLLGMLLRVLNRITTLPLAPQLCFACKAGEWPLKSLLQVLLD